MKGFNLVAIVAAAIIVCSTGVASAGSHARTYQIVPVSSEDSGGGWVWVQIVGPFVEWKHSNYWEEDISLHIAFPPRYGRYYVYFDSVLMYGFNCSEGNAILDESTITYSSSKVSFPNAIYVFDVNGNLVLSSH